MNLIVQSGEQGQFAIEVEPSQRIGALLSGIAGQMGVARGQLALVTRGRVLPGYLSATHLQELGIADHSVIFAWVMAGSVLGYVPAEPESGMGALQSGLWFDSISDTSGSDPVPSGAVLEDGSNHGQPHGSSADYSSELSFSYMVGADGLLQAQRVGTDLILNHELRAVGRQISRLCDSMAGQLSHERRAAVERLYRMQCRLFRLTDVGHGGNSYLMAKLCGRRLPQEAFDNILRILKGAE